MRKTPIVALAVSLTLCGASYAAEPTKCWDEIARPPSDYVLARVLGAAAAETLTSPTLTFAGQPPVDASKFAQFGLVVVLTGSCAEGFNARVGGTAVTPAADVTDGTASERGPMTLRIPQGSTGNVSVISAAACIVTAAYYKAC